MLMPIQLTEYETLQLQMSCNLLLLGMRAYRLNYRGHALVHFKFAVGKVGYYYSHCWSNVACQWINIKLCWCFFVDVLRLEKCQPRLMTRYNLGDIGAFYAVLSLRAEI